VSTGEPLAQEFFHRPAPEVARDLLGAVVVSTIGGVRVSGLIVDTEAYLGIEDPASHAWQGRRHPGNEGIYSPPGYWYVYRSYGIHWCANLVTGPERHGAAVLLRALYPLEGVEAMRRRRGLLGTNGTSGIADGPGKLAQALGITRELDRTPMAASPVKVVQAESLPAHRVQVTTRVGISRATDWPMRFRITNPEL
jgi:DNA-3-methyladenine glycosylase